MHVGTFHAGFGSGQFGAVRAMKLLRKESLSLDPAGERPPCLVKRLFLAATFQARSPAPL